MLIFSPWVPAVALPHLHHTAWTRKTDRADSVIRRKEMYSTFRRVVWTFLLEF